MANKIDLTGKRFGRLVDLEQAEYHIDKNGRKTRSRLSGICQKG